MAREKALTRGQKEILRSHGYNPNQYTLVEEKTMIYIFKDKYGCFKTLPKTKKSIVVGKL